MFSANKYVIKFNNWMINKLAGNEPPENCHNCRFSKDGYSCRKRSPECLGGTLKAGFPVIYNDGKGEWCGDYERERRHNV